MTVLKPRPARSARELAFDVSNELHKVENLTWAIGELMSKHLADTGAGIQVCETVWTISDTIGDLASRAKAKSEKMEALLCTTRDAA